jgi:hypothetical protein
VTALWHHDLSINLDLLAGEAEKVIRGEGTVEHHSRASGATLTKFRVRSVCLILAAPDLYWFRRKKVLDSFLDRGKWLLKQGAQFEGLVHVLFIFACIGLDVVAQTTSASFVDVKADPA